MIINNNSLNEGTEHLKVLTLVHEEFRYLRLLWTHINDSISTHYKIVEAKQTCNCCIALDAFLQSQTDADGPPMKKSIWVNIIS